MRPYIVFLADKPGWAFSAAAEAVARHLSKKYRFKVVYLSESSPNLDRIQFDLLYVFFWGENYWRSFDIDPAKVIREVASYRWRDLSEYGRLDEGAFCRRYLADCGYVTTPAQSLAKILSARRPNVRWIPNGVDCRLFAPQGRREGPLRVGWAGNPLDPLKGLEEVLIPAAEGRYELVLATGQLSRKEMAEFYNSVDVIAIVSRSESQPLPLLEGMACGCFPVATDVGIVSELVENGKNGLIVNRDIEALRSGLDWCATNLGTIREQGLKNAEKIKATRDWVRVAPRFDELFDEAMGARPMCWRHFYQRSEVELDGYEVPEAPRQAKGQASYAQHLAKVQGAYGENYQRARPELVAELGQALPFDRNQVVLEIGIGFGYLTQYLIELGFERVVAVDRCGEFVDHAKSLFGARLEGAFWCDGEDFLARNKARFDVIVLYDVIEHIERDRMKDFLSSLRGALKEGGKAIVRTPNMAVPLASFSRYIDFTHRVGFTEFSLSQAATEAGFGSVRLLKKRKRRLFSEEVVFRIYRLVLRKLYRLEQRTMPSCFEKNILAELWK